MNLIRFLRGPMPLMGSGLALVVLSSMALLGLAARSGVDLNGVAALGSLYFLVNTVALGAFSGVEQEMSRAVSQERALGRPAGPVAVLVARQAARLVLLAVALVVVLSPVLVGGPLHGHWELLAELVLGVLAACCASAVRGALAGSQRFGLYAATLATEGLARLVPFVALWLLGVDSVWLFGLVFVLGQFFAAALGVALFRHGGDRGWRAVSSTAPAARIEGSGEVRWGISSGLALLVVASLTNQAVVNLPPVVVGAKLEALPAIAAAVASAVMLTRLPMLAFVPLQTTLLPRLTEGAARGDLRWVRRQTALTVAACVVLGLLGMVALALVGPQLLAFHLGRPADLTGLTMAGLGIGTVFLMAANVTQPALVALGRHRTVLVSYLTGAAAMTASFVLPVDPVTSAVLATSAGPVALAAVMAVALVRATRHDLPNPDSASTPAEKDHAVPQ